MEIRTFASGANRDSAEGKLDLEGFMSPLVIERYAQYMHKNRTLKDGSLRDSDNWQKLFGDDHYGVCMSSGWRHFFSWWKAHRGYKTEEDIEESICALIFNAQAYLFKILKDKQNVDDNSAQNTNEEVISKETEDKFYRKVFKTNLL